MSKAVDLSQEVQAVWSAKTIDLKKEAMVKLIEKSHAKAETKQNYLTELSKISSSTKLDKLAVNYMMSGEGLKVV